MTRPLLPPRGVFIGTRLIFNPKITASIKETLLQLMALAWGNENHSTSPITYPMLESLTGKKNRTLRGHLATLRTYQTVLRLQPTGSGYFIIVLADWLFRNDLSEEHYPDISISLEIDVPPDQSDLEDGKSLPLHDHDHVVVEEEESDSNLILSSTTTPDHDQSDGKNLPTDDNDAPEREEPPQLEGLTQDMQLRLMQSGVYPKILRMIAYKVRTAKYTEEDLEALLAWCQAELPDRPAGLFVARIRAHAFAPKIYYTPACRVCGQHGRHAPDCRMRYLTEGVN